MSPKISIIVPVYKVELYLEKCINSILNQTFKDFELILVDDGSPDRCGEICDEYAKKDNRIVVVHKENGGQASARNVGLDIARGDYIGFVDSDDWIEADMYEVLYNMCNQTRCDIANCSSIIHFKDKTITNGGHSLVIHNKEEAMLTMLEGVLYDEVVWTKLINKDILDGIRFTVGIMYEDTDFTYRLIGKCDKVASIGEAKYHYIKREDSTMDRAIKEISIDGVMVYDKMLHFIHDEFPTCKKIANLKLANCALSTLNLMISSENFYNHKKNFYKVANILNQYFSTTITLDEYPKTVKLLLLFNKIHPFFYRIILKTIVLPKGEKQRNEGKTVKNIL